MWVSASGYICHGLLRFQEVGYYRIVYRTHSFRLDLNQNDLIFSSAFTPGSCLQCNHITMKLGRQSLGFVAANELSLVSPAAQWGGSRGGASAGRWCSAPLQQYCSWQCRYETLIRLYEICFILSQIQFYFFSKMRVFCFKFSGFRFNGWLNWSLLKLVKIGGWRLEASLCQCVKMEVHWLWLWKPLN